MQTLQSSWTPQRFTHFRGGPNTSALLWSNWTGPSVWHCVWLPLLHWSAHDSSAYMSGHFPCGQPNVIFYWSWCPENLISWEVGLVPVDYVWNSFHSSWSHGSWFCNSWPHGSESRERQLEFTEATIPCYLKQTSTPLPRIHWLGNKSVWLAFGRSWVPFPAGSQIFRKLLPPQKSHTKFLNLLALFIHNWSISHVVIT